LARAEREMTAALQATVDATKRQLTAEEEELARIRGNLARETFEARVAAFDQRVRAERRAAQSCAAALQQVFRAARRRLVEALGPVLEVVRARRDADLVVNADSVLAARPGTDVTSEVIERLDAVAAVPAIDWPGPACDTVAAALRGEAVGPAETGGEGGPEGPSPAPAPGGGSQQAAPGAALEDATAPDAPPDAPGGAPPGASGAGGRGGTD
ncbi:MAG: OmpH family outer membrane protein, partial [Pseudomonadota bacterium]